MEEMGGGRQGGFGCSVTNTNGGVNEATLLVHHYSSGGLQSVTVLVQRAKSIEGFFQGWGRCFAKYEKNYEPSKVKGKSSVEKLGVKARGTRIRRREGTKVLAQQTRKLRVAGED